jgi:DNA-directed RNA polymerase specialized sigma subunit
MLEANMTKNPVDEYLDSAGGLKTAGIEKRSARDQQHLEYWQTWKAEPSKENIKPLIKEFQPTFNAKLREWKAPNTQEAAFRADLMSHTIKAFESYDPNRGASLSTHVNNYLKKAKRFNTRNQNVAYIPEEKAQWIGPIDTARDKLYEDLGRHPTHEEIAGEVGIKPKLVKEIQGMRYADVRGSAFQSDPLGHTGSRDQEVISLLRHELNEKEKPVYDYVYGQNGKPKIESTGEIAKRLGMSPSQVSRIKNSIGAKYKQYV